jgi:TonB family protein
MDPAITPPKIVEAVAAVYPADVETDGSKGRCLLSLVVGIGGIPENIHPVNCRSGEAAVAAAIDAVQKSKFAPGHLNEQPVPVHVQVRVVFTADHAPALPAIVERSLCCNHTTPPKLIHSVDPQYSEEARRIKLQGVVTVSGLVTETGEMTDVQVVKSLGHGLDEKAVEAVSQYRFRPAMKDGKPVAARISVQVNFRLF